MKPIVIALSHSPGAKPMPQWDAFEVPDTDGLMAVHPVPQPWNQRPHPSRWTATHIPSGRSVPVPYWSGEVKAAWYAKEFYEEAKKHGVDLTSEEPFDGVPPDIRKKLRAVFDRAPPESLETA